MFPRSGPALEHHRPTYGAAWLVGEGTSLAPRPGSPVGFSALIDRVLAEQRRERLPATKGGSDMKAVYRGGLRVPRAHPGISGLQSFRLA